MSESDMRTHGLICFYVGLASAFAVLGISVLLAFTGWPQGIQTILVVLLCGGLAVGGALLRESHLRRTLDKTRLDN